MLELFFRKHFLPLPSIVTDDFDYDPSFLCHHDESCILDEEEESDCPCGDTVNYDKVLDKLSICPDGVGNCVICQCPLIEEDKDSPGYFNLVSTLSCGHMYHTFCLTGQIQSTLLKEISMAARVGRKMEKNKVTLKCAICQKKSCLVHGYHVPISFLIQADIKIKTQYLASVASKTPKRKIKEKNKTTTKRKKKN